MSLALPPPVSFLQAAQVAATVIFLSVAAVGYVEIVYRILRFQYHKGVLKRYYPLPSNRELYSNFRNAVAFISPPVLLYYFYMNPTVEQGPLWRIPTRPMSYRFNPLEMLVYLIGYMLMHDTLFYFMHTHAHYDKWMYKHTHAMHHEYTHEMNVFTTAYAEAMENAYQTGIPWTIYTAVSCHNFWLLFVPLSLNLTTTILGHSGFQAHPVFGYLNPALYVAQKLFGRHMLTPSDHAAHHSQRRCNFGLFFRWQDKLHGTYVKAHIPCYTVEHWMKLLKDGQYHQRGKAAAIDGAHQVVELNFEELHWGF
ncbi:hypothetical protein CALVIDRAFT_602315 [Calocera viscosa TUFC12733]|uniref:Fatty acid hydroxylase domain-containing protein n=1 Tax=Calocera viscosa (strain TUFC12733) TaxID=1330018 RepID=A0A167H9Y7_CALVF|nr:hypothetical protein CALVIDRAFT_602315 [Calocera viscosa TUFC12733]